jgi:hypothetical protein
MDDGGPVASDGFSQGLPGGDVVQHCNARTGYVVVSHPFDPAGCGECALILRSVVAVPAEPVPDAVRAWRLAGGLGLPVVWWAPVLVWGAAGMFWWVRWRG